MKNRSALIFIISLAMTVYASTAFSETDDHLILKQDSASYQDSYTESVTALSQKGFGDQLESPALGSLSSSQLSSLVAAIKSSTHISGVSAGQSSIQYDVILQPGHYGRITGAVGTAGAQITEQELVAYIVARVAVALSATSLKVLVIPADNYIDNSSGPGKLQTKLFLAVHADGSVPACKTGPSLAYAANTSPMAMHAIGWALGAALGYKYSDFKRDNFTVDEAHYYAFNHIDASSMAGLLEVGELTCGPQEQRLIEDSNNIAANLAKAVVFILGVQ